MPNVSLAQQVSDLRTTAGGIAKRLDDLDGSGVTADDAAVLNALAHELDRINAEQEELKAQLKSKTRELHDKIKEAQAKQAKVRNRIKLATPQVDWVAFGITAKR